MEKINRLEQLLVLFLLFSILFVRLWIPVGHVMYALAIVMGLFYLYKQRGRVVLPTYWNTYAGLWGIFLILSIPTMLFVGNLYWSVRTLLYMYFYPSVIFFLLPICVKHIKYVYYLLATFMVVTTVDVWVSMYQVTELGFLQGEGFRGPILSLAGMLVMAFGVSAYISTSSIFPRWLRMVASVSSIFYIAGLFSNRSRSLWLLFPVSILSSFGRKVWLKLGLLAMGALLIFVSYQTVPIIHQRLQSSYNMTSNESNLGRIYVWESGYHMFKDHPVLGIGLNQFKDALDWGYRMPQEKQYLKQAHNNFVQVFAEEGLVGGIGFLAFLLGFIGFSWKVSVTKKSHYIGMIGMMFFLYLVCFGQIEHSLISMAGFRTLWIVSGLFYTLFVLNEKDSSLSN